MAPRTHNAAAESGLREVLTPSALRSLLGISDAGEAFLARVRNADGGSHFDQSGGKDVWVNTVDELGQFPVTGRLHIPGNILFAVPEPEDTCLVVRPKGANGPGMSYVVHGDGGAADRFPSWLPDKVGLFAKRAIRIESSQNGVEITVNGSVVIQVNNNGSVAVNTGSQDWTFNGGTQKLARDNDNVFATGGLPGVAFSTWITQVTTAINSLATGAVTPFVPNVSPIGNVQATTPHVKG